MGALGRDSLRMHPWATVHIPIVHKSTSGKRYVRGKLGSALFGGSNEAPLVSSLSQRRIVRATAFNGESLEVLSLPLSLSSGTTRIARRHVGRWEGGKNPHSSMRESRGTERERERKIEKRQQKGTRMRDRWLKWIFVLWQNCKDTKVPCYDRLLEYFRHERTNFDGP